MRSLYDTNFVIRLINADAIAEQASAGVEQAFVNVTVIGELLVGQHLTRDPAAVRIGIAAIRRQVGVMAIDEATADFYATIYAQLRSIEQLIPENDMSIAATAMRHDLTLLTFDRDFDRVAGLNKIIYR